MTSVLARPPGPLAQPASTSDANAKRTAPTIVVAYFASETFG
jgi:hypothetical protein